MKRALQMAAFAAAFIGVGLVWSPAGSAMAADQKIGTVNLKKAFEKYYKTARSTEDLKQKYADIQKAHKEMVDAEQKLEDEWQKLMDKVDDPVISAEERAKSKKAAEEKLVEIKSAKQSLQQYNMESSSRMQELERDRRDKLVKEIMGVLDAQIKAGGYTLVLDVSGESANMVPVVLFSSGINDLTDNLIKELNAAELPTPATDNTKDSKDLKETKDTTKDGKETK